MPYDSQKKIYVYESFSTGTDILLGTLFVSHVRGSEAYSFEYDENQKTAQGLCSFASNS